MSVRRLLSMRGAVLFSAILGGALLSAPAEAGIGPFKIIPPKKVSDNPKIVDPPHHHTPVPPPSPPPPPPVHHTPEPGTMALMAMGAGSLVAAYRRKKK